MEEGHILQHKRLTVVVLLLGIVAMFSLVGASVPLYRLFCQFSGYGGTPRISASVSTRQESKLLTVRFDANTHRDLPWLFVPLTPQIIVKPGQNVLIFYIASNKADIPITGTATFNVTPAKAGPYFNKISCFCFKEQTLTPGQSVEMPVTFFIDPAIVTDPQTSELTTLTLSYTFFPSLNIEKKS